MKLPRLRNPETVWDVFSVLLFGLLVLGIERIITGPGPAHLGVIIFFTCITIWILWACFQLIKQDSMYPYPGSKP